MGEQLGANPHRTRSDASLDQEDRKIDNDELETVLDAEYKDDTLELQERQIVTSNRGEAAQ